MRTKLYGIVMVLGMLLLPVKAIAQEEESAEISLEAYSDAFQEHFFNALKEKAVENYEKAINHLLECKKLQPQNAVVDYELGKNHLALKNYFQAESYLKNALSGEPGNGWYLNALFDLYRAQNNVTEAIAIGKQLAQKQPRYKEILIQLYAQNGKYKEAVQLIDELDALQGTTSRRKKQRNRYTMLANAGNTNTAVITKTEKPKEDDPFKNIQNKVENYDRASDYNGLLAFINDALETYPSQAAFYYIKGKALNSLKKHREATTVLETALDFLVDDTVLENNIYKELMLAYQATGNTQKAREYEKKLKNRT